MSELKEKLLKSVNELASTHAFQVIMRLEGTDAQHKEALEKSKAADKAFEAVVSEIFNEK